MRRGDFEPLDVGAVGHDPVPPQYPDHVRLVLQHELFELAHQHPLPRRIGLAQHLLVKVDLLGIVVISVVLAIDSGGPHPLPPHPRSSPALAAVRPKHTPHHPAATPHHPPRSPPPPTFRSSP